MDLRDLAEEAATGLLARPVRSLLTVAGTVLGVSALVATMGVARTAANQISVSFDLLEQTSVTARAKNPQDQVLPWDAEQRLRRLNGVKAAGTLTPVDLGDAAVTAVPINNPGDVGSNRVEVLAASPGLLEAVHVTVHSGRSYDIGHSDRQDRVVLVGEAAARTLQLSWVGQRPAVAIGDTWFSVIGIVSGADREPRLLNALILPEGTARALYPLSAPSEVRIDTEVGAAQLIARQAALALNHSHPEHIEVLAPPSPESLRGRVEGDVNALFLVLGGISLLVGAIGIANVTLVSVMERIGEIGLRRALGADRRDIAAQVLTESAILGLAGGAQGASVGVLVTIGVAWARSWTPVLDPWLPIGALALGTAVGLTAGVYPALKAARLEPIAALRAS